MRFFGFRYYSADMGRFIHADPLEERGAWTLYSGLSYGTTNPFFGSSGLGGKDWLDEWEQVQDGLTRNASFSHSTEEIQFTTLRNSGNVGSYEQNKKFYSANAGVTIGQGGSRGLEFDSLDIGTMTYSGSASPSYRNIDTNLYAYVGNNPYNMYDPLDQFGVVGFAVGFAADLGVQAVKKTVSAVEKTVTKEDESVSPETDSEEEEAPPPPPPPPPEDRENRFTHEIGN